MKHDGRRKVEPQVKQEVARGARSIIRDASESELRDALSASGHDFDHVAAQARQIVQRALQECTEQQGETDEVTDLHRGLCALIQMLRRRDQLSVEALAERATISAEEIRKIECDPLYTPAPRTIYQLEQCFSLPRRSLVLLSGAVRRHSPELRQHVARFAANSSRIGGLSSDEKKLLNEFVTYLRDNVRGE